MFSLATYSAAVIPEAGPKYSLGVLPGDPAGVAVGVERVDQASFAASEGSTLKASLCRRRRSGWKRSSAVSDCKVLMGYVYACQSLALAVLGEPSCRRSRRIDEAESPSGTEREQLAANFLLSS